MLIRIVSGTLGGRRCSVPTAGVRPTSEKVRAAFFDALASLINFSEATFIDLFAGSGAMAFEAFSRGFSSVIAIEKDAKTLKIINENKTKLLPHSPSNFLLLRGDSTSTILQKIMPKTSTTVVFMDPPYMMADKVIDKIFPRLIHNNIVKKHDIIVVESDKKWETQTNSQPFQTKKYGDTLLSWFRGEQLNG